MYKWEKDTNGLFDFEDHQITTSKTYIVGNGFLNFSDNKLSHDLLKDKLPLIEDSEEVTPLLSTAFIPSMGYFFYQPFDFSIDDI